MKITALMLACALGFGGIAAADGAATFRQAQAFSTGIGGVYDPAGAVSLFERAAAEGEPRASLQMALLYHTGGPGLSQDPERAADLYRQSAPAVERLAAAGDSHSQYLLGLTISVGLGGPADPARARPLLEQAAAGGETWAMHDLGWMSKAGSGVPADPDAALRWYRRAADAGHVRAMWEVGALLLNQETGSACAEAVRWLDRAASAGHTRSAALLGNRLLYGLRNCRSDPSRALHWLERAVAAKTPGAAYDLGFLLLTEPGRQDPERARKLLMEAADEPTGASALDLLAFLHVAGVAVPRDPEASRALLERSAALGSERHAAWLRAVEIDARSRALFEQGVARLETLAAAGDAPAQALLAQLLHQGRGLPMDQVRAVRLARTAAEAGQPDAMRVLAHAYEFGEGIDKNAAESKRWWRRCAESGHTHCMLFYSQMLRAEDNPSRDLQGGIAWLLRAAEAGNRHAMESAGHMYDEGWYGPRDEAKALPWKRKLAASGDVEARGWLLYHGFSPE